MSKLTEPILVILLLSKSKTSSDMDGFLPEIVILSNIVWPFSLPGKNK